MTTDECMNVLNGLEQQLAKAVSADADTDKAIEVEFTTHRGEPVVNKYNVHGPRSIMPASVSAAANLALFGSDDVNEPVILSADVVEPTQATATGAATTQPETTEPKESLILEPEVKSVEAKSSTKSNKATKAPEQAVAILEPQTAATTISTEPNVYVFDNAIVRTDRTSDGEPLFCAKDVCDILGYANARDAVRQHTDSNYDVVKCDIIDKLGRKQSMTFVNESGLYALIFGSKLESAKAFRRWITSEVLPSIRTSKTINAALIDVHMQEGRAVTTSRNVAEVFDKNHKDVLRDIRNVLESNPDKEFGQRNFAPTSYKDQWNRKQEEYALTRDGTMLLIMGYTGPKAMALKTAYIKRFNEMEQALRNGAQVQHQVGYSPRELLDAAELIYQSAGLEGNQLTLALDKANTALTGKSLLALGEVQLIASTQERLLNPTELGKPLGLSPRAVNSRLQAKGFQIKGVAGWELTASGKALGGIYLDTGKKHSSGVPVRQIKWPATVATEL